ncbi:MAG: TetR/AcrR family transcriptional regulator [Sandaracinaceae bacterium]|nr:TetR/AcrR family transcriptional regulator [Sandaracinaceae bacterium]
MDSRRDRRDEIKETARALIARDGAAALSLGSIARALGISTPALYRYFASRDALVTALVVDGYADLGEQTERAVADLDPRDFGARFRAIARAYRAWALAHPQDYVLIHGAVVPGYRAPLAEIATAAVKILRLFVGVLSDAEAAGALALPPAYQDVPTGVGRALQPLTGGEVPPRLVTVTYLVWAQLHALVWQELDGHLPRALLADGELYDRLVEALATQLGLGPPAPPAKRRARTRT